MAPEACHICLESPDSIFSALPCELKDQLASGHVTRTFQRGDIIYCSGDRPSGILCLAKGKAKVIREGVTGREQIVRLVKPVGFIGYRAFFADEFYQASAIALEDSVICQFNQEVVLEVMKREPDISMMVTQSLARELGESHARMINLTQKHLRGRLAESLLFLIKTYGFEPDGLTIRAYLSREDLANLSNMTTSNAIRTLSTFCEEGLITINGREIRVLDVSKVERVSAIG